MFFYRTIFILLPTILVVLFSIGAQAHDSRPLFIEIKELSDNMVRVAWTTPPSLGVNQAPRITLGPSCMNTQRKEVTAGLKAISVYRCPKGVSKVKIGIDYPLYNPSISTLIRVEFVNGQAESALLDPSQEAWIIPERETFSGIILAYFIIGAVHIFSGMDHLLFIMGLVYVSRTPRRVLITVTSFTIAHSGTIFLVMLDLIRISNVAAEIVISFSVMFIFSEIIRDERRSLTWRYPVLVAGVFGLVHGMGFAAALSDIGLPQTEKISALLFFNMGVEAGQLVVIAVIFSSIFLITYFAERFTLITRWLFPVGTVFLYSLGITAAFWFIERMMNIL